ncbi:MAG: RsmE family RNA methyltransferase [Stecheria intestinalis]|jgi:16S rRNA (uracil1498-N3)-methyltransferase|nr:RsmE family RNA methyltransferase [Stecheria intestinalis]
MQQYFTEVPLEPGMEYVFPKAQAHHAGTVLRMNHETIRLVHDGIGYFADAYPKGKEFAARVLSIDPRINELPFQVTLAQALIRREKMELILQKAAELGVTRIVPFESSRCVVHARSEKADRQKERWNSILQEASEQCKRNRIPELENICSFGQLSGYSSELNLAAYENAYGTSPFLLEVLKPASITIVIGPEGGFSEEENAALNQMGFSSISLGSRILRAETAAISACALISGYLETAEKDYG